MKCTIRKTIPYIIFSAVILIFCLFFLFHSDASANTVELCDVTQVESVLIKKGDTLSSIATEYAGKRSHLSDDEYMRQIIQLNNLKSEHIQAGHYILLPDFRN